MRHVKLDRDNPLDLHEQAAGEIRRAIADGEAKPGERLPPAKDLAAILGVNTNTVLRALRQLRCSSSNWQVDWKPDSLPNYSRKVSKAEFLATSRKRPKLFASLRA
jgi:DNA-binding transcriptional MocR family regulator